MKVYCKYCHYSTQDQHCKHPSLYRKTTVDNFFEPEVNYVITAENRMRIRNEHNDCSDYEEIESNTAKVKRHEKGIWETVREAFSFKTK